VISFNAVYIGVDADWNDAESLYSAHIFFILCENFFCVYFTFEWIVRFLAFKRKSDGLRDGWFKFDSALVLLMVVETWIFAPILAVVSDGAGPGIPIGPLRLLRLLRLTRMARLMKSLPELVTMTKGMMRASRAVGSSLLMVAVMIYTFAIILNMLCADETDIMKPLKPRNFETIPRTMWTLLVDGTFMDSTGFLLSTLLFSGSPSAIIATFVFMTFLLLSAITVMNMLIGVLCEVVSAVGQSEKDDAAISLVKATILMDLKNFDDGDGLISRSELMKVMKDPQSKAVLRGLNVDILFVLELQSMLFPKPDSRVSFRAIMELMLMCRGDLPVTVQHMASAQASMISQLGKFEARLNQQLATFQIHS
jgi:voltage-gated sodium channel